MRKLILVLACSLAIAACSSDPFSDNEPNTNSNTAVANPNYNIAPEATSCGITTGGVIDEKALLTAETAYNLPAQAYVKLGSKLKAETRATVRNYLIQAYDYLKLARQAYNAGDGCSLKKYGDLAKSVSDKANILMPASE